MNQHFCSNCKEPLPPDSRYCPNCGAPVQNSTGSSSSGKAPCQDNSSRSRKGKTGLIIAVVCVVFVFAAGLAVILLNFIIVRNLRDKIDTDVTVLQEGTLPSNDNDTEDSVSPPDNDPPVSGKYRTIEDFIHSDLIQSQLEDQIKELEGTGVSLTLEGKDNRLIYNFVIENENVSSLMNETDSLASILDSQSDTFRGLASMLRAAVDVEDPVIVIRYLDSAGNIILSREFEGD